MRQQLFWQTRTHIEPDSWGILLLESLAEQSFPRKFAESVSDVVLITSDGYVAILMKLLRHYQAYLEIELEKAT